MARLGEWLAALRDHSKGLPDAQYRALSSLGVRLNWVTGRGFASVAQVAGDAYCGAATVRRAITWARGEGLIDRTARGHSVGRGSSARASEYVTRVPSQPLTGEQLIGAFNRSTGRSQPLNRALSTAQSFEHPSKSSTSKSSTSKRGQGPADIVRAAYPDATDDEIKIITEDRASHGARNLAAVLAAEVSRGTLRLPCDRNGPGDHTNACRDGDPGRCGMDWCACRCHTPAKVIP